MESLWSKSETSELLLRLLAELEQMRERIERLELEQRDGLPRCPACGSDRWIYREDRQVCASCGR